MVSVKKYECIMMEEYCWDTEPIIVCMKIEQTWSSPWSAVAQRDSPQHSIKLSRPCDGSIFFWNLKTQNLFF